MKFAMTWRIVKVKGNQITAKECHVSSLHDQALSIAQVEVDKKQLQKARLEPIEPMEEVVIQSETK